MRVFVTGASGQIGSAVIPELLAAGHEVVGLVRSDSAAANVAALGATVRRGDLDDLDGLKEAAADSDGVIHLAFRHDLMRTGDFAGAVATELDVVRAFGDVLAGTDKALVAASGTGVGGRLGRPATEEDAGDPDSRGPGVRAKADIAVVGLAERGVRSSVVRIPPVTHGELDRHGFARSLIAIAKDKGVSGYAGDGANRWPAVHVLDLAHLFRLALEDATPGARWHAAADEGIAMREIAQSIGDHLGIPTVSIPSEKLQEHFGFFAFVVPADLPATSHVTRRILGWEPTHPGLLEDFDKGDYFPESSTRD